MCGCGGGTTQATSPALLGGAQRVKPGDWIVEFGQRGPDGKPITQRVPDQRSAMAVAAVNGGRIYPANTTA